MIYLWLTVCFGVCYACVCLCLVCFACCFDFGSLLVWVDLIVYLLICADCVWVFYLVGVGGCVC